MRKIVLFIAMSLDGYIARNDGDISWLEEDLVRVEEDNTYEEFCKTIDTVIIGRKTYDQVTLELMPNEYPYEDMMSYIMTSTPEKRQSTENKKFTGQNLVELVTDLKNQPGKDIWIIGGQQVIEPLLKENLIDEYQVAIIPKIIGSGIPLFSHFDKTIDLKLEKLYSKNQLSYLIYTRINKE